MKSYLFDEKKFIPSHLIRNTREHPPFGTYEIPSDFESNIPDPRARAQLDMLCKLIGKSSTNTNTKIDFKLNLFNNEEEEL